MPADTSGLPELPAPRRASGPYRISFVCLGNICRSPMAEVVLRAELAQAELAGLVELDSAGTGDWHLGEPMDRRAQAELSRRGYDGSAHRARQFRPAWFAERDLILALDLNNLRDLRLMAPDAEAAGPRLMLLRSFDPGLAGNGTGPGDHGSTGDHISRAVPDPYGGTAEDYARALDMVRAAARGLTARLTELLSADDPGGSGGSSPRASSAGEAGGA